MMIDFSNTNILHKQELVELFRSTFTDSEGADEGIRICDLVNKLMLSTKDADLYGFKAEENGRIIGGIFFSRLSYNQDNRTIFLLAPVAVATSHQKKGIGQKLLKYGLDAIRKADVDVAFTYGDPSYYSKVGFVSVDQKFAAPPFKLSYPNGWLAQSLTDSKLTALKGNSNCVDAFDEPALW